MPASASWSRPGCWWTRSAACSRPPRAAWAPPSPASATPWPACAWPSRRRPPTPRTTPPGRPARPPPRAPPRRGGLGAAATPGAGGLGHPAPAQRDLDPRPGLTPGTQQAPPSGGGALRTLRDAGRQRTEGPSCSCSLRKRPHVRGLGALGAVGDLELDGLALVECLVAVALDGREVDEDVVAAVAGDEAVALLVAEPLDG